MIIRRYCKALDEKKLMKIIKDEEGWNYADASTADKYRLALENSITYVAYIDNQLCGYSRSINDCGFYIYVCDLLVNPKFRGKNIGSKIMECIYKDFPEYIVYVMSDVDDYYQKLGYVKVGSVFEVPKE